MNIKTKTDTAGNISVAYYKDLRLVGEVHGKTIKHNLPSEDGFETWAKTVQAVLDDHSWFYHEDHKMRSQAVDVALKAADAIRRISARANEKVTSHNLNGETCQGVGFANSEAVASKHSAIRNIQREFRESGTGIGEYQFTNYLPEWVKEEMLYPIQ